MERWVQNAEHKCVYLTRTNQLLRASLEKKEKVRPALRSELPDRYRNVHRHVKDWADHRKLHWQWGRHMNTRSLPECPETCQRLARSAKATRAMG
jgi:hypothetical protein